LLEQYQLRQEVSIVRLGKLNTLSGSGATISNRMLPLRPTILKWSVQAEDLGFPGNRLTVEVVL
jgi:hypothetical protein